MKIIFIVLFIALIVCLFFWWYFTFQKKRIKAIAALFDKWGEEHDIRFFNYDFDDIFKPCWKNHFGLAMPKEEDYGRVDFDRIYNNVRSKDGKYHKGIVAEAKEKEE